MDVVTNHSLSQEAFRKEAAGIDCHLAEERFCLECLSACRSGGGTDRMGRAASWTGEMRRKPQACMAGVGESGVALSGALSPPSFSDLISYFSPERLAL